MNKLPNSLQEFCFSWSNMCQLAEILYDNLDNEAEVVWICNVVFINIDNKIDETQFDIPVFKNQQFRESDEIVQEVWELWIQFAKENQITEIYDSFQTIYIDDVER